MRKLSFSHWFLISDRIIVKAHSLNQWIWASAILLLPITSLPVLVHYTPASTVAPPSSFLFLLLGLLFVTPLILKGGRLPFEGIPLLVFLAAAFLSTVLASFYITPPFRGQLPYKEGVEGLVTLVMGLAVFFVTLGWLSASQSAATNTRLLKLSLMVLNISGILLLGWSAVQIAVVLIPSFHYPRWYQLVQESISIRSQPLFDHRVTGMAYEPSWFAHQLNLIYLPFWLACVLQGYSVYRIKYRFLTVEFFLLLSGVVVLLFSFSRVGIGSFALVVVYCATGFILRFVRGLHAWLFSRIFRRTYSPGVKAWVKASLAGVIFLFFMAAFIAIMVAFVFVGAKFDWRLALIVENNPLKAIDFYHFTNNLVFAERFVYWATGWQIFNQYPLFGAGIGQAGFYFSENMPAFGYGLTEVTQLFYYESLIPNTKSMWIRLLAETGLVGFSIFVSWYYVLWKAGRFAQKYGNPLLKTIGFAGQLVLLAFLVEGFSVDSFALPYFWFAAGVLAAASYVTRQVQRNH